MWLQIFVGKTRQKQHINLYRVPTHQSSGKKWHTCAFCPYFHPAKYSYSHVPSSLSYSIWESTLSLSYNLRSESFSFLTSFTYVVAFPYFSNLILWCENSLKHLLLFQRTEFRFQYLHQAAHKVPLTPAPGVQHPLVNSVETPIHVACVYTDTHTCTQK